MRLLRSLGTLALVISVASASAFGQENKQKQAKPPAAGTAKRTCDPSKVHTGPRGGRYYLTKQCRKVYIRK